MVLTFRKVAKPPSDHGGIPSIRFAVHIRLQCIRSISARPIAPGGVTYTYSDSSVFAMQVQCQCQYQ
jgi:hypothetical protein